MSGISAELLEHSNCFCKNLYKQSAIFQLNSHGDLLRQEMKKSHVPGVFITSETSRQHDRHFNLHVLTLTALSVAKIWKYFFLMPFVFTHLQKNSVQIWRHSDQWFFFIALRNFNFDYNQTVYPWAEEENEFFRKWILCLSYERRK